MSSRLVRGFSLSGVMDMLKPKGKYGDYNRAADDEEGRVPLTTPFVESDMHGESHIALLDTDIPNSLKREKNGCCMCFGRNCSLLWKAIALTLGLFTLYSGYKALRWSLTDAPTGLEELPAFSSSLGCLDVPFMYNKTQVTTIFPIGSRNLDHFFDIRGGSVGTITIIDGHADSKEVKYEITVRADQEDLNHVHFVTPDINPDGTVVRSRLIAETPYISDPNNCIRFDLKMYIPPNLKKLHVASHTNTHVQFAPGTSVTNVEELYVTLFAMNPNNIIALSPDVLAEKSSFEVYRGWIVGDASVVEELDIVTQRGDGVANVKVTLAPSNPEKATIRTVTGAGRSDFTVVGGRESKRQIDSTHSSSRNADMYLTYREAEFNGKIELESKSYTVTGAQRIKNPTQASNTRTWTHFVGDAGGKDVMQINSRGWTGLYF